MNKIIFLFFTVSILISHNSKLYSQSGWVLQQSGTTLKLNKVFFINSQTGWVVGDSGKILKTTNEGTNWFSQNSNINHTLVSVQFINESTGYIAGGNKNLFTFSFIKILKTTNGGIDWILIHNSADLDNSISDVYFTDSNNGFVICGGGNGSKTTGLILKTTNGGINWIYNSSDLAYRSIQFKGNNRGYIIANYAHDVLGDSIHVLKTTDAGSNWTKIYSKDHAHLNSVHFINQNTGWAAGFIWGSENEDMILKTSNGGINWQIFDYPSVSFINSIFFSSYDTGWFCNSGIFKSINSGANWINQIPSNGNDYYTSITFIDNNIGWAIGSNGKILSTVTGGINSVSPLNETIPADFSLNQNYPNPFNPSTNINFSIPKNSFVTLKVFDMMGREIASLVNENLNSGVYNFDFNGDDLPSGVYFYKLSATGGAADYSNIKKMTLLK